MAYVLLSSLIFLSLLGFGPPVGGAGATRVAGESKALIRAPSANTHSSSHLGSTSTPSSNHPSTDLEPLHLHHAQTPNQRFPPPPVSLPSPTSSYDLLDTILVASIDGKFHALNRTSGQTLWSMAGFAETTSVSAPAELGPLVGTVHSGGRGRINGGKGRRGRSSAGRGDGEEGGEEGYGEEEEEEEDAETYIIEPQSGDIYVLTSPSSALQRFPFSMAQLVDISPFTSTVSGDDVGSAGKGKGKGENTRVFVGRKETSLLVIELETGRVKATLNAECPFVPEPEEGEDDEGEDGAWEDEDVGEGQGRKRRGMISAPTEVYIGRTDYHISILKKPTPANPSPPTQELRFSTYGPNNRDNHLQAMYRRTRDDVYVQSLPNGDVIAFKTGAGEGEGGEGGAGKEGGNGAGGGGAMWGKAFPSTIVAIFDVLKPPHPSTSPPFVLLQPRPSLADLFPHASSNELFPFGPGNTNTNTNNGGSASGNAGTGPGTGGTGSLNRAGTTAYIGIVEGAGTESLYVLSPERYPLVVFGSGDGGGKGRRARIEGPKSTTTTTTPTSESGATAPSPSTGAPKSQDAPEHENDDRYTKPRYQDSHAQDPSSSFDDLDKCLLRPSAPRCLVGIHALMPEGNGDVESVYGRWKRLIDGPSGGNGGSGLGGGGGGQQAMDNGNESKRAQVIVPSPRAESERDNASGSTDGEGDNNIPYDTPRWPPVPRIGDSGPSPPSLGDGGGGGGWIGGIGAGDWEVLSALVMFLVGAVVLGGRVRGWVAARGRGVGGGLRDAKGVEGVKEMEIEVGRGLRKDKELPEIPGLEQQEKKNEKEKEEEGERGVVDVVQLARPSTPSVPSPGTATDADAEVMVMVNGDAVPVAAKDVMEKELEKKVQAMEKEAPEKQQAIENEEEDGVLVSPPSTPLSSSAHPVVPPTPLTPSTPRALGASNSNGPNDDDGEDSDADGAGAGAGTNGVGAAGGAAGKKKSRRGKRGKKKKGGGGPEADAEQKDSKDSVKDKDSKDSVKEKEKEKEEEKKPSSIVLTSSPKPVVVQPSLYVSDTILGFGSHGTVVFQGSLQGRAVAVKRLLQDFVTLAAREVSILQESDDHPNVIRYYYQESHANFLYIALELCPASLADIIEAPDRDQWREIAVNFEPKRALRQIGSGMRHLHALGLVHRDIKPQNILVGIAPGASTAGGGGGKGKAYRMLISDFGLCKKLDVDQTSFLPTAYGAAGAGTVGWRAPEILRGEVKLDWANGDESLSSRGSVATVHNSSTGSGSGVNGSGNRTRLTKSVDIFALGCLFYYTLTSGGHPYGDRFEREVNIMRDAKDLGALERFGEEGTEARDLIRRMLSFEARDRPDTTSILLHPFFWDPGRRLNFLQDASDRFEIMCREPRDPHLLALEKGAFGVVGNDWQARLDRVFIENLGKFRKYDGKSVQDLMRALRNKKHHYQDLPDNVKRHLGPMPEGYLAYFTRRYPALFLHVHGVVKDTGLSKESMFRAYFELPDL